MTMEFTSLFEQAGYDAEAEQRESALVRAQAAAAGVWPFLSLAQSEREFGHRLALCEDRLTSVASQHGVDYEDLTRQYLTAFTALREQRQQHTAAKDDDKVCEHCQGTGEQDEFGQKYACENCDGEGYLKKSSAKQAGFPTCALGCGYTLSAQDDVVNIRHATTGQTGMAHRRCFEIGKQAAPGQSPDCRNCGHANPPHRKGGQCSACGCDSYQPQSRGSGPRRAAKEASKPDPQCPDCGGTGSTQPDWYDHQGEFTGGQQCDCTKRGRPRVNTAAWGGPNECPHCGLGVHPSNNQTWRAAKDEHLAECKGDKSQPVDENKYHMVSSRRPSFDEHIAMLRQALQEGQDPLAWIEQTAPGGQGQPEKPGGHTTEPVPYTYAEVPPPGTLDQPNEPPNEYRAAAEKPGGHSRQPVPLTYADQPPQPADQLVGQPEQREMPNPGQAEKPGGHSTAPEPYTYAEVPPGQPGGNQNLGGGRQARRGPK